MEIKTDLKDEIWEYCRVNQITNIDEFYEKLIQQGFTIEKYGATPKLRERVVEKIVEVPVEKIVEKETIISNDEEVNKLGERIKELTEQLDKVQKELIEEKKKKRDIYGEG